MNLDKKNQECHESNKEGHKGIMKHGFMMMLCCLIPIVIIAGLPLFGIKALSLSGLMFLLCPLLHIGMIFMMRKSGRNGSCHGNENEAPSQMKNKI